MPRPTSAFILQSPLSLAPRLEDYDWGSHEIQLGIHGYMQYLNASLALQLCNIWLHNHDKSKFAF